MTELLVAVVFGAAATLTVWALRGTFKRRFDQDVAWLQHTVWRFTPDPFPAQRYVLGFYAFAALVLFGLFLVAPNPVVAIVLWLLLIVLPRVFLARAWTKRRKKIEAQLPLAARQMASSVGSGMSLAQAIDRLAERGPDPIRTEFHVMSNYWKLGSDFSSTIEEAKRRLSLANFNLFASALAVNQTMGGNLTQTLDRLADSLEAIDQMRREVHAATAEGRTNIKVLCLAPFIMVGLVALMDTEAVMLLLTSGVGHGILAFAGLLTGLGTWWAWKIVGADV